VYELFPGVTEIKALMMMITIKFSVHSGGPHQWVWIFLECTQNAVKIFTMHFEYPGLYEELSCRLYPGTLRLEVTVSESYACLYYVLCCRRKSGANNLDITLAWRGTAGPRMVRWWRALMVKIAAVAGPTGLARGITLNGDWWPGSERRYSDSGIQG